EGQPEKFAGAALAGRGAVGRRRLVAGHGDCPDGCAQCGAALRERPRRSKEQVMVNHVVLVGNLGSDPEVRTFGDQQKVTRLSLATREIVRKRSGERERQTEWHQVVAWAALGERAAKHLRKGRNVLVEGRLQTRVWADARGIKHITAEVRADRIPFLGSGRAGNESTSHD